MGFPVILALRGVQLFLALVGLGLSCYVANWYNVETFMFSPSQINFLIFSPIWSLISLVFLEIVSKLAPRASHPHVALVFESSNVVFWFAGFVALAVFIGKLVSCQNSVCSAAQVDVVVSALQSVGWSASMFFMTKNLFNGGHGRPATAGVGSEPM